MHAALPSFLPSLLDLSIAPPGIHPRLDCDVNTYTVKVKPVCTNSTDRIIQIAQQGGVISICSEAAPDNAHQILKRYLRKASKSKAIDILQWPAELAADKRRHSNHT